MKPQELAEYFYKRDKSRYYRLLAILRRFENFTVDEIRAEIMKVLEI